jgi:hypothetical protein
MHAGAQRHAGKWLPRLDLGIQPVRRYLPAANNAEALDVQVTVVWLSGYEYTHSIFKGLIAVLLLAA